GWLFDAMEVGIVEFIIAAFDEDWGLTSQQMGWIGGVNSIGMAVGEFVFGIYADRVGRKKIFINPLLLFSLASGISAFTTT
ncbi:MFS transporter, partial [Planococcus sp. SIMBA_143]